MAVDVSDPLLCCVTPMAQRMQTRFASAIACATCLIVSTGSPQMREANSSVNGSRLFRYSSEPFTHRLRKSVSARPLSSRYRLTAESQTRSVLGARMQENIGAPRHLVLPQVGDDQLLAVKLVRPLDARSQHGMTLCRVAADDHNQVRLFNIRDRTRISAVAHGPKQAGGRRRLAVPRTVIHVVRADHRPGQFLHQIAFFVGAFGRGDEPQRVRAMRRFDLREAAGDKVQRLLPPGLAEVVAFADQRTW